MKIYKRGKKTFVDGEGDLTITKSNYTLKVDFRFMRNHEIKNFFVVGIGSTWQEKIRQIYRVAKYIWRTKPEQG